jgi:hypothetical protein
MRSWRADSLCLRVARSRNYPMLQKSAIKEQGKRRIFLEPSVAIRSIESGEDAVILATAAAMQHTRHRLVVVEQPVWRAAGGSVR